MSIREWMIPDESDPDVEQAIVDALCEERRPTYSDALDINGLTYDRQQILAGRRFSVTHPSTELAKRGRSTMSEAKEELRAALLKYADVESLLGRFGGKQPPVGSVLRWTKVFPLGSAELRLKQRAGFGEDVVFEANSPTEYVYVAIRAGDDRWYVTGTQGRESYEWDALVRKVGDAPAQLVSEWTEVPVPAKPREESMQPEAWARLMFGEKTVEGSTSSPTE